MKQISKGFVAVALIALMAAGCNQTQTNTNTTETPSTNTPAAETKTFTVDGDNFKFNPAEIRVNEGDTVVINFRNTGGFHDWVLDEFNAKTKQLGDGQSETVTFVASKKGTFEYYCSVGQHRQMGMKGNLIVE